MSAARKSTRETMAIVRESVLPWYKQEKSRTRGPPKKFIMLAHAYLHNVMYS